MLEAVDVKVGKQKIVTFLNAAIDYIGSFTAEQLQSREQGELIGDTLGTMAENHGLSEDDGDLIETVTEYLYPAVDPEPTEAVIIFVSVRDFFAQGVGQNA